MNVTAHNKSKNLRVSVSQKFSEMVKYIQPPKWHSDNILFNSAGIQVKGMLNG